MEHRVIFFWNDYFPELQATYLKLNTSFLATNNRGSGVYEIEKGVIPSGAAVEHFEDCLFDINAWIEFAISKGYKKIILEGHSFGTEKVVYYMAKGKYIDKISAVILFGFSDTIGTQNKYLTSIHKRHSSYLEEAKQLIKDNKPYTLLSDPFIHCGELPLSATSYINFYEPCSELSKAFPLRKGGKLENFRKIKVPILGVISDNENGEYTIIPIKDAINLLKVENKLAEIFQIKNTNHGFNGKEKELAQIVKSFIQRRVLNIL